MSVTTKTNLKKTSGKGDRVARAVFDDVMREVDRRLEGYGMTGLPKEVARFTHSQAFPEEASPVRRPNRTYPSSALAAIEVRDVNKADLWDADGYVTDASKGEVMFVQTQGIYQSTWLSAGTIHTAWGAGPSVTRALKPVMFVGYRRPGAHWAYNGLFSPLSRTVIFPRFYHGRKAWAIYSNYAAGATITFHHGPSTNCTITWSAYIGASATSGSWYDYSYATGVHLSSDTFVTVPVTNFSGAPASGEIWYIAAHLDPGNQIDLDETWVSLGSATGGVGWGCQFANVPEHLAVYSFDDHIDLQKTGLETTNSASVRMTYEGSDFKCGGQLTCAALCGGVMFAAGDSGDFYKEFGKISYYCYRGPLKSGDTNGCRVIIPSTTPRELQYIRYLEEGWDQALSRAYAVGYIRQDEKDQSIVCTTALNAETLNVWQVTDVKLPMVVSPLALAVADQGLASLPWATENAGHKNIFQKAWGSFKNWIKKPSTWKTIGSVGGTLAALL